MNPDDSNSIDNRYSDLVKIAERGLANAYAATDTNTGERVFLKILRESKVDDAQSCEMFEREIVVLQTLSSEESQVPVPKLLSEGIWKHRLYFTQPLLDGASLDRFIRKRIRFSPKTVLKIIDGCLSFLTKLHDAGYVHGDISPDNIFMQTESDLTHGVSPYDFEIVLLDYNSSRRIAEPVRKSGERRIVFLKLSYAAPSVASGYPISVKSDLYSLGVVFFELLVGERPFQDPKTMQAVRDLYWAQRPNFPFGSNVPNAIALIVQALLQTDPQLGFFSAAECHQALREATDVARWLEATETSSANRDDLPDSKDSFFTGSQTHSTPAPVWSEVPPITEARPIPATYFRPVVVLEKSGENRRWECRGPGTLTIGRAAACDIQIEDSSISRITASIIVDDSSKPVLKILSSVNAPLIRVNGEWISNEPGARRELHHNDSIEILNHEFQVLLEENSHSRISFGTPEPIGGPGSFSTTPSQTEPEAVSMEVSMAYAVPVSADSSEEKGGIDLVEFSVFAPASVVPETSFILEIWAYLKLDREEVLERAGRRGRLIEKGSRGPVYIQGRSEITLVLRLDNFELVDTQDTIIWSGDVTNVSFIVKTPKGLAPGIYPGQVNILHNGLLLTRLIFELTVGKREDEQANVYALRKELKSAFASYASTDRDEVLRRVQGIRATGMDVFVDVLSLRVGEAWEEELYEHIRSRDIFYLFWSSAARDSEWVAREWHYALKEKGLDFIHPIPLVAPDQVPPPEELRSKHFNDIILAVLKSQQMASMVH